METRDLTPEERRWLKQARRKRKLGPYVPFDERAGDHPRCIKDGCNRIAARDGYRCSVCAVEDRRWYNRRKVEQ